MQKTDVEKIAHLARLAIDERNIPEYAGNLTKILEFIEQMNAVDTSHVEPMAHPLEGSQRLRQDKVTEKNLRAHYQDIAPQVERGLYLVPKFVNREEP